ncbi:hypothetical protein TeGR_g3298 [Tetraparma gracilis]|uniref:EF-hand domain-containing protein n=1 Tax=Tetraparma gracilis TaxID=2962635 RepID=A0ABQ6NAH3_9STRA|nr:hypothetical protein TeGR_g3298 [Tetraparma gracilis]
MTTPGIAVGAWLWVELICAALVWWKLYPQTLHAHPHKEADVSHASLPAARSNRTYSDQLHTSYIDAVNSEEKNPFVNDTKYLTEGQRAKIAIMTVTVLPVRVALSLAILLITAVYAKLATIGMPPNAGLKEPISPLRTALAQPLRLLLRSLLFVWGFHWVHQKGKKASAREAPVIAPNHICFVEPLALVSMNLPMSVGAYATMMFPGFSSVHRLLQNIPLEKYIEPDTVDTVYSRQWVKHQITSRCQTKGAWPQLMIFPEGTTHNQKALVAWKNGPFLPGVPVQPIVVRMNFKHHDPAWVTGGQSQLTLIHRMLCQVYNHMEIEYLPVYKPSEAESGGDWASSKLFAKNVRAKVAEAMDVPVTEHSYEDVRLAGVAAQLHLPVNDAMIEIGKAKSFLGEGVTLKTIEKHLNAFASMDVNKTGQVTFEQFAEAFDLKKEDGDYTAGSRALFDVIDHNGDGTIHFKDYLFGLALVNETPANRQQLVKLAFTSFESVPGQGLGLAEFASLVSFNPEITQQQVEQMFSAADHDGDGKISYKDFNTFVQAKPELLEVFKINFLDRSELLARKAKWRPSIKPLQEAAGGEDKVANPAVAEAPADKAANIV